MKTLRHKFVKNIPENIEEGILYISMEYGTAIHKCPCGCGNEVVTPFSHIDWKLIYDGKNVSIEPSIGNWGFECKSHYWIINNEVRFARKWFKWEINLNRRNESIRKTKFYKKRKNK